MFELDLFLHPLNEVKSELDILNHKITTAFRNAAYSWIISINRRQAARSFVKCFSDLRAYMEKRSITCRDDVLAQRLRNRANDSPGTNFHTLYNKALSAEHTPKVMQTDLTTDSTHSAETGFKLSGASWENIRQIFGPEVIKCLNVAGPSPQMTTSVSGWFPRAGGDGYIWLDVESDNLALSLLDITGKIRMERVRSMFGERVHGLIEKSDLRQRENQELAETNCVKMTHCIEIRIGAGDLSVINKLFE
ncbi:uncharacterized protein PG998_014267 [Apiospora kogelbergensis]|uniref:uncharacterized protein n=1 Tax=Apiospora kogelbergensis TaxID=1337665 RepID=UPI00312F4B52